VQIARVLGQAIVRPKMQGAGGNILAALTGDQDNRDGQAAFCAQHIGQFETVHAGQAVVDQQHVPLGRLGGAARQLRQRFLGVA